MSLILWIVTLFAASIGVTLASLVNNLDIIDAPSLILAIFWFLIAFTTYFFAGKLEEEESFGLLSLNFIVTWAFCTIGFLVGSIVIMLLDTESVTLKLDSLTNLFFKALPLTIGPTATASMGLRKNEP